MEEHIASGGFGKVVKAQNKLDHKFYAIKKIPLIDTDVKKILQVSIRYFVHALIVRNEEGFFLNLSHPNTLAVENLKPTFYGVL